MFNFFRLIIIALFVSTLSFGQAQDTLRFTGHTMVNVDYHHGQLSPAIGVHNIQVSRANRGNTNSDSTSNWTYNHAPMMAYWNNRFYLSYLSNPIGEHVPPGQSFLVTSKDGYRWSSPSVLFPPYKIPDGTKKEGRQDAAKGLYAVMHQRMGFYVSKKKRLLALAYYGISFEPKDGPNDGNGVGRVVREIYADGKYGPIYFIRYNHAFNEKNTAYPFYTSGKDAGFAEACKELLDTPLQMQQWMEEADVNDPLVPLKGDYKAFSSYHLPSGKLVGLWKNGLTSISKDDGKTWLYPPLRAPKIVNSNAKIWGQKTSDGRFALVYNPSEFRWPLAVSVSDDGVNYKNLLLVHGEITSMRYGGSYKSYGPQYVRGISEGDGIPPDKNLWVTYSVNKEDIWVSSIPVPVKEKATADVNDVFDKLPAGKEMQNWNIYSPLWAPVSIEKMVDGTRALLLRDKDPFDYAKVERVLPEAKKLSASFSIIPHQSDKGLLDVEFQNAKGSAGIRISFDSTGSVRVKAGYRYKDILKYKAGEQYDMKVEADVNDRSYTLFINGKNEGKFLFFAPLDTIQRISFRTGDVRRFPNADTPTDQMYDLPNGNAVNEVSGFYIKSLITKGQ